MKILFVFLLFALPFGATTVTEDCTTVNNDLQMATVEVEYVDGTVETFTYTVDELRNLDKLATSKEVVACTYQTSDGTCACTAPTCAQASDCFFSDTGCVQMATGGGSSSE